MGDHDQVRIGRSGLLALAATALLAPTACAPPGTNPSAPSPSPGPSMTPPADCDISRARITWSGVAKEPTLTNVVISTGVAEAGETRVLVDTAVVPSIDGVVVTGSWVRVLTKSLSAETGEKLHTDPGRPSMENEKFLIGGPYDADITEMIIFAGVNRVEAAFTVSCSTSVHGTLVSWASEVFGGVPCAEWREPADPFARLARRYCPKTPSPPPSLR